MDRWVTFPDPSEPFPTYHEIDPGHESTPHDFISAQQTTNLLEPLHPLNISQEPVLPVPQDTRTVFVDDFELTAAMGPPPKRRKKKAPTLRAKDWEPYKARILELHDAQKLPLPKVREMIEEEFGFTAELRQYRTRISQWGKDKNIKPAEMAAIVRKRQQRKLVEIDKGEQSFSVRGRDVDPHKIDRWMARNEVSQTSLYAPSPVASTPSAILCRTISERGSVAPSPAFSTRSLSFSTRSNILIRSSMVSSPAALMLGMGDPQNVALNIQSNAYAYQPVLTLPSVRQSPASDVIPLDQPPRRYKQAEEEAVREALSVAEDAFGVYHSQTLELRIKLGCILLEQGRYMNAEEIARDTLEDCEEFGDTLIIKLDALQLLSEVLHYRGSCHQARKLQEWLFEWGKVNLGEGHPSVIRAMIHLSKAHLDHGNLKEGEELCAQALKMNKEIFGELHDGTIGATAVLACTYTRQGRLNEAERLGLQLLTRVMAVLGNRHEATIVCMSTLADVYRKQGRSNEAEELQRQVLEMSVDLVGKGHPSTIYNWRILAEIYQSQGRLEEARYLGEQALVAARELLGEQHPQTFKSLYLLVGIYEDQGQIEKAEELEQQAEELERQVLERQEEDVGLDFSFMAC